MENDVAYANADFIPDADAYIARWEEDAQHFRETEAAIGRARLNLPYGAHERKRIDLFYPAGRPQGLVVFIHGGYWLRFDRSFWSHFSTGLTARGWAVAMPSYRLAPDVPLGTITRDAAAAVTEAASLIGTGPIRLIGHSAGGHLVSRMGNRDVALAEEVRARLARIIPISPVSDLRPLMKTSMNADLRLDDAQAEAESSVLKTAPDIPVSVWVGAEERPAFLDQARWLAEAWGAPSRIAPGCHHFDVIDGLRDPTSPMVNDILA